MKRACFGKRASMSGGRERCTCERGRGKGFIRENKCFPGNSARRIIGHGSQARRGAGKRALIGLCAVWIGALFSVDCEGIVGKLRANGFEENDLVGEVRGELIMLSADQSVFRESSRGAKEVCDRTTIDIELDCLLLRGSKWFRALPGKKAASRTYLAWA